MHHVLRSIQKAPRFVFGDCEAVFTCLLAFITGYEYGYMHSPADSVAEVCSLVPIGFQKFVEKYYAVDITHRIPNWGLIIQEHSASEKEAFDLFYHLLEQYDRANE